MLASPKADDGDAQRPLISAGSVLRVSAAEPKTQMIRKRPKRAAAVVELSRQKPIDHPSDQALATTTTRHSLEADNLDLQAIVRRQGQRVADLEARLSELVGEQAYS